MSSFYKWLVTSSANPRNTSLAVKGFLVSLAPFAMMMFGVTDVDVNAFVNAIVDLIFYVLSAIATVQMLFGFIRKISLGRWSYYNG